MILLLRSLFTRFLMNFFASRTGGVASCLYAAVSIRPSSRSPAFGSKFEITSFFDAVQIVLLPQDKAQAIVYFMFATLFWTVLGVYFFRSVNLGCTHWFPPLDDFMTPAAELVVPFAYFMYGPVNTLLRHYSMERATFAARKLANDTRFLEYLQEIDRVDAEVIRLKSQMVLPLSDALVIALQGIWELFTVQLPAFIWAHPVYSIGVTFFVFFSFWAPYALLFRVAPRFKAKWAEYKLVRVKEAELECRAFLELEAKQKAKAAKLASAMKAPTKGKNPRLPGRGFHSFSCAGGRLPRFRTFRLIF